MTRIPLALLLLSQALTAAEPSPFAPLFNGRDLDGWVNVNCAPETWSVRDGVIYCTGKPTGALRTTKQYENFVVELEWRHLSKGGNSGIFIWATPIAGPGVPFLRSVEVQVLENDYGAAGKNEWFTTHGDVFPIHGSTMTPFGRHNGMRSFPKEERSKPSPEWNHYRISCTNGVIRLSVNGAEVSGGENCVYRKGYFGLESEGAPVEFRDIRLQELPAGNPPAEVVAPLDLGWRPLFTGLDLRGWQPKNAAADEWSVRGEMLVCQTRSSTSSVLWSEREFRDAEFVIDYRPAKSTSAAAEVGLVLEAQGAAPVEIKLSGAEPGKFQRYVLSLKGANAVLSASGKEITSSPLAGASRGPTRIGLRAKGAAADFMNLYARDL